MTIGIKYLLAAVAFFVVAAIVVVFATDVFSRTTAETRGERDVREDTVADGDYRIAAYERFYDMCAAVQTAESRIGNAEDELRKTKDDVRARQLIATLAALNNNRAEAINEYNADARKEATAAQFKASDLPDQLDPEGETSCTAETE